MLSYIRFHYSISMHVLSYSLSIYFYSPHSSLKMSLTNDEILYVEEANRLRTGIHEKLTGIMGRTPPDSVIDILLEKMLRPMYYLMKEKESQVQETQGSVASTSAAGSRQDTSNPDLDRLLERLHKDHAIDTSDRKRLGITAYLKNFKDVADELRPYGYSYKSEGKGKRYFVRI